MVIYNDNNKRNVQFVSYTGKFPNLCGGVLTLNINGREVKFGHESDNFDWNTCKYKDDNYNRFWQSGGYIDNNCYTYQAEWDIWVNDLPDAYQQYAYEIAAVFNENVPHGCCGGCV